MRQNVGMTVREAVLTRRAMRSFDPTEQISLGEVELLLHEACLAPSALNLQNWEFIVCLDKADKNRLREAAFDQQKLADASAVVIILGNLVLHERVARNPEANCFPAEEAGEWERLATWAYADDAQRRRDEAFRSCSLFAMTLMLLAQDRGWWTAPVGGFDADKLTADFGVPEPYIPVLLIAIGQPGPKPPISPRARRVPIGELIHFGRFGRRSSGS
jgi:nitroreductase